ncbi:hypothetical protein ACHAXS_004348 [Conticribra weissflogii]
MVFPSKKRMQQDTQGAVGSGFDLLFQASQLSENRAVGDRELQRDAAVSLLSNVTSNAAFSSASSNSNSNSNSSARGGASAIGVQCESHFEAEAPADAKIIPPQDVGDIGDADLDGGTVVSMTHSEHGRDSDQIVPERNVRDQTNPRDHPSVPSSPSSAASGSGSDSSRTFPQLLHLMLASPSNSRIVSWLPSGDGFVIRRPRQFAAEVLPLYFRKTALESFVRKLNRWGFRRIKLPLPDHCRSEESNANGSREVPTQSAFAHKYFLRDDPRLCAKMFCRSKPTCSLEIPCVASLGNVHGDGETGARPLSSAEVSVVSSCSPVIASSSGDHGRNSRRDERPKETHSAVANEPKPKRVKREPRDDDIPTFTPYGIAPSTMEVALEQEEGRKFPNSHAHSKTDRAYSHEQALHDHLNSHQIHSQFLEPTSGRDFPQEEQLQYQQQHQQQYNYLLMHQLQMRMMMRMHWQRKRRLQWQLHMQMQGMGHDHWQGHLPVPSTMAAPFPSIQVPSKDHIVSYPFLLPRPQPNGLDIDVTSDYLSQKQQHYPPLFCTTATQKSREYLRKHHLLR